jgi:hypothetical protein
MAIKKRELVEPQSGDKRFIHRDDRGRFAESADVGRSLKEGRPQAGEDDGEVGPRRPRRPQGLTACPPEAS